MLTLSKSALAVEHNVFYSDTSSDLSFMPWVPFFVIHSLSVFPSLRQYLYLVSESSPVIAPAFFHTYFLPTLPIYVIDSLCSLRFASEYFLPFASVSLCIYFPAVHLFLPCYFLASSSPFYLSLFPWCLNLSFHSDPYFPAAHISLHYFSLASSFLYTSIHLPDV